MEATKAVHLEVVTAAVVAAAMVVVEEEVAVTERLLRLVVDVKYLSTTSVIPSFSGTCLTKVRGFVNTHGV